MSDANAQVTLHLWSPELGSHLAEIKTALVVAPHVVWMPGGTVKGSIESESVDAEDVVELRSLAATRRLTISYDPSIGEAESDAAIADLIVETAEESVASDRLLCARGVIDLPDDPMSWNDLFASYLRTTDFDDVNAMRDLALQRLLSLMRDDPSGSILDTDAEHELRGALAFLKSRDEQLSPYWLDDLIADDPTWNEREWLGDFPIPALADALSIGTQYVASALPFLHTYPADLLLEWLSNLDDSLAAYRARLAELEAEARSDFDPGDKFLAAAVAILDEEYEDLYRQIRAHPLWRVTRRNLPGFVGQEVAVVAPSLIVAGVVAASLFAGGVALGQAVTNAWQSIREARDVALATSTSPLYWRYALSPENWTDLPDWLAGG